jgi:hypothetical protein
MMLTQTETSRNQTGKLDEFRLIPRVDTWPQAVSLVQKPVGKLLLLALFAGVVHFLVAPLYGVVLPAAFAFITFLPEYRRPVLTVAPPVMVAVEQLRNPLVIGETFAVMALGIGLWACVLRWPKSRFGRRPLVYLLSGFSALIMVACATTHEARLAHVLWPLVGVAASYVWFIAYAVTDKSSQLSRDLGLEVATFRPLWGTTNTPFPKGAAYLRRIEAKTPEQLAVVQLKGLKLLVWALLLVAARAWWFGFFHHYLHIPVAENALAMSVRGTPVPWAMRWAAQILAFFEIILGFSIMGHTFIGCCRMAGFNALRNTYRPLSSTTLIDFFNRFYYYFKELLVDLFYYPTFLRYFKKHRRLRTVFATFAAVVFGNAFYHITRDWRFFQERGFWGGLASYQVEFVYCIVLAAGLSISQLRKRGPRHHGFLRGRLLPFCGVALFYVLISVFETDTRAFTLPQTLRYFASLFLIHS